MPNETDESIPCESNIDGGPIRELVARYVESVALFDVELYRSVWTHDAVWEVDGRGDITGVDDITKLFVRLRGRQEMAVQRVMSGRAIAAGDHGVGRWVIHSLTRTNGKGEELIGVYDDGYRRDDGVWRFVRRAFSPLYRGAHELPGRVWSPPPPRPLAIETSHGTHPAHSNREATR
jgi:ketosteroid isomerase-like protein